jgi:hypothetical protein
MSALNIVAKYAVLTANLLVIGAMFARFIGVA